MREREVREESTTEHVETGHVETGHGAVCSHAELGAPPGGRIAGPSRRAASACVVQARKYGTPSQRVVTAAGVPELEVWTNAPAGHRERPVGLEVEAPAVEDRPRRVDQPQQRREVGCDGAGRRALCERQSCREVCRWRAHSRGLKGCGRRSTQ